MRKYVRVAPLWLTAASLFAVSIVDTLAWSPVSSAQSTPCCGGPIHVPGIIDAAAYDMGGPGVAYHDTDAANHGGGAAYRPTEGVDTHPSAEGGHQVGWTADGEWLQYTVQVDRTADYSIQARVSSPQGGAFRITVDGVDVTGVMTVNTGSWSAYQNVSRIPVRLYAGRRVLRVVVESGAFDFRRLHIREVAPKGARLLGMDAGGAAESALPIDAFQRARAAGAEVASLSLNWDQIEPTPGRYVDPYGVLSSANSFYPSQQIRVSLTIRPIDGASKPVPPDLRDLPFNHPAMLDRFDAMLVWVLQQMPDVTFTSIQIGSEPDLDPDLDVVPLAHLVLRASRQIKALRPDVKVGYTARWYGLVHSPTKEMLSWLTPFVDVVGVTYYPLAAGFQVRHPLVVQDDFDTLMRHLPDKTVFFQEIGYPSGALCSSSEIMQNDFVQEVFAAWDRYAAQIGYLSFVRVQDWSEDAADAVATGPPYFLPYPEFSAYLRTLGFRTYEGAGLDKPAMRTLVAEGRARGWN